MSYNPSKLASLLGICAKARKLICGIPLICRALKSGSMPQLVLYSHSASENAKKRITDRCLYYKITCVEIPIDTEDLAECTGKSGAVAAVGIRDAGLARAVLGLISTTDFNTRNGAPTADGTIH